MFEGLNQKSGLKVSPKLLTGDWGELKQNIREALDCSNYNEAFRLLEGMGYIGWKYNFLPQFFDDDVESLIQELSLALSGLMSPQKTSKECVVFYDFFSLENRGFTQQYLDEIIKNDLCLYYIVEDTTKVKKDSGLIKTIDEYVNGHIISLDFKGNKTDKLLQLVSTVTGLSPSKVFIQNSPWDILSCCFGYLIKNTGIKTYLINITDHTFWPGKSCFDYFIDFRKIGFQINRDYRGIDEAQLIIIPTPAFKQTKNTESFKGFPVSTVGKVIGFAGGSHYKIVDKNMTFLNLIKNVINENEKFIFFYANVDGDNGLTKFIRKNKLETRFILIGERTDIDEVFKNIDIFFNTYPYGGGLMLQYAVSNHKPIVAFSDPKLLYTRIDKVLDIDYDERYIFTDQAIYLDAARKLISSPSFRKDYAYDLSKSNAVNESFSCQLTSLLKNEPLSKINLEKLSIDVAAIRDFHILSDSLYLNEYSALANHYLGRNYKVKHRYINKPLSIKSGLLKIIPARLKKNVRKACASIVFRILNDDTYLKKLNWKRDGDLQTFRASFKYLGANAAFPNFKSVENPDCIQIGDNFRALDHLRLDAIRHYDNQSFEPEVVIGNNVTLNSFCHIGCINKVHIGNNVLIASKVFISDHSHGDVTSEVLKYPPAERRLTSKGPVIIEDNVWIGENVCVFGNVTIGKNCIIGANSVVTKSIPDNCVAIGSPARILKRL